MSDIDDLVPEFSRPVTVAKIPGAGAAYKITATATERAALARRFGLLSLDRLDAEVRLQRASGDVLVAADVSADLVQACVVTLEPVPAALAQSFTLRYRPGIDETEADRLALENPEEEIVEPLLGEAIDIGEAVAQELSIAMEPYPRAPGVPLSDVDVDTEIGVDERPGPFHALAALKRQQ
jgi:uncharacterized metal-binding protein YceD (DUF177 family)